MKFTEKHLCQSLVFNKVAGLRSLRLWYRCFKYTYFYRTRPLAASWVSINIRSSSTPTYSKYSFLVYCFMISQYFSTISSLYCLIDSKPFDGDALSSFGSELCNFHFHTSVVLKLDLMCLHRLCSSFFQHCLRLIQFLRIFLLYIFISINSISLLLYVVMRSVCTIFNSDSLTHLFPMHPFSTS